MFIFLALMTGMGLLIKYILVPGSKRWDMYGRNVDLTFLGLDRHGWGTVHLIIAVLFIALLVLHIILHWRCLINYIYKAGVKKVMAIPVISMFGFILLIMILFPLMADIKVTELGDGRDRFLHDNIQSDVPAADRDRQVISREITGKGSESDYDSPGENLTGTEHHDIDPDIEVLGSMSIINVSMKYNVPVSHIIKELDLPYSVSGNEQLGRLRRLYGFKMSDIELIIHKYRHK